MNSPESKLLKEIQKNDPELYDRIIQNKIVNRIYSFEYNGKKYKLKSIR